MKCKRETDGRKHGRAALLVIRQQAVKAVRGGQDIQAVADAFGVNVRSVFRWLSSFATGGQNALLEKRASGRPAKISPEEMRWLANAMKDNGSSSFCVETGSIIPTVDTGRLWACGQVAKRAVHMPTACEPRTGAMQ